MTPVYFRDPATRKLGMIEVDTSAPAAAIKAVADHLDGAHIGPVLALIQPPRADAEPPPLVLDKLVFLADPTHP